MVLFRSFGQGKLQTCSHFRRLFLQKWFIFSLVFPP